MSKLGKSFKNKFLRRALAMLLAGTMVLSGMPASFAAEQPDAGSTVETELQGRTEDVSEEAAEEDEVAQKESEETEAGEESRKPSEESETISKEETTVQSDKESENAETETYEITSVIETEESETNTEEEETEQTTEEEENEASIGDAALAEGHANAKWGVDGKTAIEKSSGIYTNSAGDTLYIDATTGKFAATSASVKDGPADRIQVNVGTKIYIPVSVTENQAKIIIYQRYISDQDSVIYDKDATPAAQRGFTLGGEGFLRARCSSLEKAGDYYRTELVCELSGDVESAVIWVEVKGTDGTFISQIISGEEVRDDVYDDTVGASADFVKYNMEGYANAYGVTGGGVIKEGTANYYTVSTADDFIETLKKIKTNAEPAVIRITENLNLGSKEFKRINVETYDRNLIRGDDQTVDGDIKDALMHPVLKRTGVSHLTLKGFKDLTIFSTNGAAIKHCKITIQESNNIMFRNLVFDELWEWDDIVYVDSDGKTSTGQYDRNDWDYMTIDENSDGVWVDHCTFYKAYDGIIDVKKAKGTGEDQRVTVSWCKFEPKSAPKTVNGETTYPFYDAQMRWLEANKSKTQYYKALTAEKNSTVDCKGEKESDGTEAAVTLTGGGYSAEDVITYTCGQKKTHLLGQSDTDNTAKGIRVTLANNSYKNSMDRMPRLRFGKAHVYNCVLDASELYKAHYVDEGGSKFDKHLVSNGALSTLQGYVYLENCYIDGIKNPLVSGNDKSAPGYIGANSNCIYMLNGEDKTSELRPANNNSSSYTGSKDVLEIKNISELNLPDNYGDYSLYNDVSGLASYLSGKAGAGVVVMNPIRWTKTNYNGTTDTNITDEKDDTDPARNDNTDYSIGEEGGGDTPTPPTIEYPEDSLILDANKLPDITIETEQKINNQYAIIGTSDAAVTIGNINEDGSAITINEKEFSKQIQLGGTGDSTKRTIKITVAEAGKLAVYAQTEGTEDGTLVLKGNLETSQEAANTVTASEPAVIEYTVSEAGTYYLYSTDSNINIFYAEYTVGPADDGEKTDTFYDATEGDSAELTKYNLEGFAASARVTGGGLLKEGSKNYYVVTNEQEFIDALNSVRSLGTEGGLKPAAEIKPAVIEIQEDLNLGYLELKNQGIDIDQKPAKTVIEKHRKQPLIHPTLKETGVSKIKLNYFHNLTIYSKNGNSIKHCGISFEGATSNIIIRNITFDEFWEWDEKTSGNYDENDWDYMTVDEQTDGLWVDHCTFYKAYDGIIDVRGDNKKQIDRQRVTISWCEFLPGSKDNIFFDAQMDYLEANKSATTYYKRLRDTENMSEEDVWWYAYGQKKTHLFGADDSMEYASMIRVTMANNYYKNSMDRMPRLRYGKVHEYNCILDAQDLYDKRETAKHITSNGAISTCGGEVLLENCQIKGIENPLLSGNGSSPTGYINAINSLYYLNGVETELKPTQKGSGALLITDVEKFKNAIPYKNYVVYDASTLESTVMPGAGAGKINMSTVQWEKVSYGARSTDVTEDYTEGVYGGDAPDKPTAVPGSESQATAVAAGTKIELNAEGADNIYYTTGTTPEDTADPKDSQSGRQKYDAEMGIVVTEAVTIKAVAEKGNRYSEVATYTYTIVGGDTPVTPPDPDDPDKPVEVKIISLDDCVITVPAAIYNKKTGNKQSTAYVIYRYTDANGDQNHVRFVEGVDYKAEWKKDGNNYSVILTGSGRSADGRDVDTYIIDEKSSKEIPYKVYATAKDANLVNISKAKVDFKAAKKTALKNVYYTGYAYEIEVGDLDFSKDKSGLKDVPQEYLRVVCSNNINAGKAVVTISVDPAYSDGKYAGVKTLSFTIKKAALNKNANKATAAVSFDKTASSAQSYMGTSVEAKDLQVTAKNGVKLRKNEDYTVTYKNSVKNGKVNVTVTVKGVGNNLSGTWSDTFAISQLDLGSQSVEIDTKNSTIPYSSKGAKLGTITVTKDSSICTLKEGVDYTAKYEYDPVKKYNVGGKVTAVITGKGVCKGTRRIANLEIVAADFNSDEHIIVSGDVTVDKDAYNKNKTKAIEKAVTVTDASGVKLKVGKDFKIEEHSDTKTLVIQPVGSNAQNYTGTKTVSYRIATNLAKDKNFAFDKTKEKNDPLVYDGRNPVKLTTKDIDKYINKMSSDAANYDQRKYRLGGSNANIVIVPGTYKNNAKKGTAQVTVRGIAGVDDGFYGTKVLKFKIVEQ